VGVETVSQQAFVGNSNILMLHGLKSFVENSFINSANVTVTVTDLEGNPVEGTSWPQTVAFVLGSDGEYIAVLSNELELIPRHTYVAHVHAFAYVPPNSFAHFWTAAEATDGCTRVDPTRSDWSARMRILRQLRLGTSPDACGVVPRQEPQSTQRSPMQRALQIHRFLAL
jgi:hypothetical protein